MAPLGPCPAAAREPAPAAAGRRSAYSARGSEDQSERLGALRFEDALLVLRTKGVAPLMVAQQLWDLLQAGRSPRVVSVSSEYGSVSENTGGFPYYYAASKAALNMLTRSLAAEARRSHVIAVVVDPGWVSTDMGGPEAPVTPARSVGGLMRVLDGLTARDNGRFLTWEGAEAPW